MPFFHSNQLVSNCKHGRDAQPRGISSLPMATAVLSAVLSASVALTFGSTGQRMDWMTGAWIRRAPDTWKNGGPVVSFATQMGVSQVRRVPPVIMQFMGVPPSLLRIPPVIRVPPAILSSCLFIIFGNQPTIFGGPL